MRKSSSKKKKKCPKRKKLNAQNKRDNAYRFYENSKALAKPDIKVEVCKVAGKEPKPSEIMEICKSDLRGNLKGKYKTFSRNELVHGLVTQTVYTCGVIKLPRVFSFIDEPDAAIDVLNSIVDLYYENNHSFLDIDQSEIEVLCSAANAIFDTLVMESYNKKGVNIKGRVPKKLNIQSMVKSSGIVKKLGIKNQRIQEEQQHKFITLDVFSGKKTDVRNPRQERDVACDKIEDYFNDCLKKYNLKLNNEGAHSLKQQVGEIINNCEWHSGQNKWWMVGYMDQSEEEMRGICKVAIFNFGKTIYQSLTENEDIIKKFAKIKHMGITELFKKFTSFSKSEEEERVTLLALQHGITRYMDDDDNRGTGTIRLIEWFYNMSNPRAFDEHKPSMTIISGRTQIKFDEKYTLMNYTVEGGERQVIAFNKNNNLAEPPDKNNVKTLNNFFPGTIISARFWIDGKYLDTIDARSVGAIND